MFDTLADVIEYLCNISQIIYLIVSLHLTLLVLSLLSVLVGEPDAGGTVVLLVSTVINTSFIVLSVGVLFACRRKARYDDYG